MIIPNYDNALEILQENLESMKEHLRWLQVQKNNGGFDLFDRSIRLAKNDIAGYEKAIEAVRNLEEK